MKRKNKNTDDPLHGGVVHVPRSRGAVSGILLIVLGAWGALIPFIGPWFSFALSPDKSWHWTTARGWLEVLPGAAVVLGGLLLLLSANRITASVGAWLGVAGGAWFVVGINLQGVLHIGSPGQPTAHSSGVRALESLVYFDGLGVVIVFVAASVLGRLSVRSVRDARAAQRREADRERVDADEEARRREVADRRGRDNDRDTDTRGDATSRGESDAGYDRTDASTAAGANEPASGSTAIGQHERE